MKLEVKTLFEKKTLMCIYGSIYGKEGRVSVLRYPPEGFSRCIVRDKKFVCSR